MVSTSSDPRLGAIRLAWWRERLEQLDGGRDVPAEPRLQAVARELLPRGIAGKELSQLEDGWLPLLEPFPWGSLQAEGLTLRGRLLFGMGARLLGGIPADAEAAGALWALEDGAAHSSDQLSREFLLQKAREAAAALPRKVSGKLRPLTVLAALAAANLAGASFMRRGGAALRHRLTGRLRG